MSIKWHVTNFPVPISPYFHSLLQKHQTTVTNYFSFKDHLTKCVYVSQTVNTLCMHHPPYIEWNTGSTPNERSMFWMI